MRGILIIVSLILFASAEWNTSQVVWQFLAERSSGLVASLLLIFWLISSFRLGLSLLTKILPRLQRRSSSDVLAALAQSLVLLLAGLGFLLPGLLSDALGLLLLLALKPLSWLLLKVSRNWLQNLNWEQAGSGSKGFASVMFRSGGFTRGTPFRREDPTAAHANTTIIDVEARDETVSASRLPPRG